MSRHGRSSLRIEMRSSPLCDGENATGSCPQSKGLSDGFAEFLLTAGVLAAWEQFPDPRLRRSIPIFFFGTQLAALVDRPGLH
jgi:hypothetical protein